MAPIKNEIREQVLKKLGIVEDVRKAIVAKMGTPTEEKVEKLPAKKVKKHE